MKRLSLLNIFLIILYFGLFAQWEQVGLDGKPIYCISSKDQIIYVGTSQCEIHYSLDSCESWNCITNDATNVEVISILVTDSTIFEGTKLGGMYRSINNGQQWTYIDNGISGNKVYSIIAYENKIYAGTIAGAFVSTDGGITWDNISNGLPYYANTCSVNCLEVNENSILAAIGYHANPQGGIFRLDNESTEWNEISDCCFNNFTYAVASIDTNIIAGGLIGGIHYSNDDGINWDRTYGELKSKTVKSIITYESNVFTASEIGVFQSTNFGQDWQNISLGLPNDNTLSLKIIESNIYVGTANNGIWRRPLSELTNDIVDNKFVKVSVYPNPAKNKLFIELGKSERESIVLIANQLGQIIYSEIFSNRNLIEINIADYNDGIYTIQINNNSTINIEKFIIQR
jgi:photosystem II stability/assembly factor-like uncharacterized protein